MLTKLFGGQQRLLCRIPFTSTTRFLSSAVANNVKTAATPAAPAVPPTATTATSTPTTKKPVKPTKTNVNTSAAAKRQKHKTPFRRASKLLNELKQEAYRELRAGRKWPRFNAGDLIEVTEMPFVSSKDTSKFRAIVIAQSNRGAETRVRTLSVEEGTEVVRTFPLYSPLIKNIRVVFKAWIHRGKKRVRRSKIYYLERRDPKEYTVDEVELQELLAEQKQQRIAARNNLNNKKSTNKNKKQ